MSLWFHHYQAITHTLEQLMFALTAIIQILFAGAVAKDCGRLINRGHQPILVSASTWAFTTLLGGVWVAGLYWFLHHSTLTRHLTTESQEKIS
jgi:hypothetical protein